MSQNTSEKLRPRRAADADDASSHPLDDWLKRELQTHYAELEHETLPPEMAELAEKLERKLKFAYRGNKNPGKE